ncbi:MAG TPA: hypothetical protein VH394_31160, partial [Thermoanaerobaculia bacterium]|nr:hypothetical protein [Thermoanaerobaculia bacterium]
MSSLAHTFHALAFVESFSRCPSAPSRLNCWIANTLSAARFPWDRWRLAGTLKTLGRRPDLLAGAETIAGV